LVSILVSLLARTVLAFSAGRRRGGGPGADGGRFVEALLVVVEGGQRVQRLGVIGLVFERLLPVLLGQLLVLLLEIRGADVVVALETRRLEGQRRLELRDRGVVVVGAAGGHALVERGLERGDLWVGAGRHGRQADGNFGGLSDADAHVDVAGAELVDGRRHAVAARLQPELDELAAAVRLGAELAVAAFHGLDGHRRIRYRLAFGVHDLALDEAGLGEGGRGQGQYQR
jgi:hypothetical protein